MKIKNSSKYFWQILCLIAVAGCEDDVARYRDIFQCPEGQIFDSTGTCGNANELCGSLFCQAQMYVLLYTHTHTHTYIYI